MVAQSKAMASTSAEHEFVLLQAATFFVGALVIYLKIKGTESKALYFSYVMCC